MKERIPNAELGIIEGAGLTLPTNITSFLDLNTDSGVYYETSKGKVSLFCMFIALNVLVCG